jgi:structure-specific endonuclease subunit SLX1
MCPTNNDKTIHREDEISFTDNNMSTTSSISKTKEDRSACCSQHGHEQKEANPAVVKKCKPKKRQWGWNKKRGASASETRSAIGGITSDDRPSSSTKSKVGTNPAPNDETADKHFHCYLLRSLDPDHPLKTYIGFTTHPQRRIRQHNGILKNAGARRTKISGRPWTFVCVIHGFQDKITALQFEWAWQNVNKSLAFREAVGDDKLASKMKRRYSPNARLEELRILLKECLPFCLYSLTVYFPERKYYEIFNGMLKRGKNGNPYKKDYDETNEHDSLMSIEVCSLENMPVAKEATILKEKKKAKQEAEKIHKQHQKKSTNNESVISDWLENAKSITEEGSCWSDFLDDEVGSNCVNLETIEENDSSISSESMSSMSRGKHEVDDLSKAVLGLFMDASKKQAPVESEECDFSTISSADSTFSLDDNEPGAVVTKELPKRGEKENQQQFDSTANIASFIGKISNVGSNSDVVDLCNSP